MLANMDASPYRCLAQAGWVSSLACGNAQKQMPAQRTVLQAGAGSLLRIPAVEHLARRTPRVSGKFGSL